MHALLFSEDREDREEGLQRCEMWTHRGKVPSAVEATVVVLAAQLEDQRLSISSAGHDPLQLRMAYSMALTRFVNGVVDMQQRGRGRPGEALRRGPLPRQLDAPDPVRGRLDC